MKKWSVKCLGTLNHKRTVIISLLGLLCLSMISTQSYLRAKVETMSNQVFEKELENLFQNELEEDIRQTTNFIEKERNKESQYYIFFSTSENEKLVEQQRSQTHKVANRLENVPSVVVSYISDERVSEKLIHRELVIKEYY